MRSRRWLWLVLVAALALVPAACGRDDDSGGGGGGGGAARTPGSPTTTIKLGGSYPFSGPGVGLRHDRRGRQGVLQVRQRQGRRERPQDRVQDARRRLRAAEGAVRTRGGWSQQDKVFALFNTLGTPNNLAIWDYVNQQKVPQLYVATGASDWGKDIKAHPYTIGWQPELRHRGQGLRRLPQEEQAERQGRRALPERRLRQGPARRLRGGHRGLRHQGRRRRRPTTSPTRRSRPQVGRLARSGADTFLNITTPKFSAQAIAAIAKSDWKPLHILNNVGAVKNARAQAGRARERQGHRLDRLLQGPAGRAVGGRRRRSRSTRTR